jgi:ADP-heptose:LPS heptosyltransferase
LKKPLVFLVRKMALGDVLWIEPVVRQLASTHKRVIVYTRYPELFLNYPLANVRFTDRLRLVEKVWRFVGKTLPFTRLHIGLDRSYENNQKVHFLSAYQQAAGLPITREYPRLYLSKAEEEFRPKEAGTGKYVVVHLESAATQNFRKVYGVEWEKIVSSLAERAFTVIQTGKDPAPIPGAVVVKGNIRDMIALIRGASFFVGLDSGPSHIAAALGVPALIFFGAINPDCRHFRDLLRGQILQQPCECAGWYHETNVHVGSSCSLIGDGGVPKCALHTTGHVLEKIEWLIREYQLLAR